MHRGILNLPGGLVPARPRHTTLRIRRHQRARRAAALLPPALAV